MSSSAQRCLKVLQALSGHTFAGISNKDLAAALGESAVNISRALEDLINAGFAQKRDDGRFSLSISVLQIASAHAAESQRLQQRIDEINRRTSAY